MNNGRRDSESWVRDVYDILRSAPLEDRRRMTLGQVLKLSSPAAWWLNAAMLNRRTPCSAAPPLSLVRECDDCHGSIDVHAQAGDWRRVKRNGLYLWRCPDCRQLRDARR